MTRIFESFDSRSFVNPPVFMALYSRSLPTGREVRKVARAVITILEDNGFICSLFGSAACAIYGMDNRQPNVMFQS